MRGLIERILFVSTSNPKAKDIISFLTRYFPEARYHVLKVIKTPAMEDEIPEEVKRIADKAFLAVLQKFSEKGIKISSSEAKDVSSKEIISLSTEFDLICIPTTILVKHTQRVSSTTKEVLRKSKTPMMIYSSFTKVPEEVSNILILYNPKADPAKLAEFSLKLSKHFSASVYVIYLKGGRKGAERISKIAQRLQVPVEVDEISKEDLPRVLSEEEYDLIFLSNRFSTSSTFFPTRRPSKDLLEFLSNCPCPSFIFTE